MDLKSGIGWELEVEVEVEQASRPVRPVAMSTTRSSSGRERLGVAGRRNANGSAGRDANRGGGKGGPSGRGERRGSAGGREKSGENVMPIVDSRRKGRVLIFGGEKGRGRRWIGWKEANELERFSVGAIASNAIVLSYGFVECGGKIKEPGATEL